jgi:hypothetical protein
VIERNWTKLHHFANESIFNSRAGHGLVAFDDYLFVSGGYYYMNETIAIKNSTSSNYTDCMQIYAGEFHSKFCKRFISFFAVRFGVVQ